MAPYNFILHSNCIILIWAIDFFSPFFYVFLILLSGLLINLLYGLIMLALNHFLKKVGYHK